MSYLSKPDSVVLFDSSSNIEELKRFIQNKKSAVITFDYESHIILSKNNIVHEISDSYLNENDLQTIQKHSYHFAEWFKEQSIINFVHYEGVNLGELFYVEFHYLLVPFLKKFVEISRIINKFNNAKFVAQNTLYEITSHLSHSVEPLGENNEFTSNFLYDSVNVNLKIRNTSFTLVLSRSFYMKLKKISEKLTKLLLNPRKNLSNDKTVLLVEFDAIRYSKIFSLSLRSTLNLVLFYRRRPAVWNFKSYSIIKNSNCILATYYSVVDKHLKNTIKNGISLIESRINSLIMEENFFKSFFSINGISFWRILKPFFAQLCKKRMVEGIEEIEIAKRLLEKYRFSSVLLWNENGFNELIIIKLAKKYNIPITLIQHGLYHDTPEAYEFNEFRGVFPIYSDKFVVWGKVLERYAINCGIPTQKIKGLGSPLYDELFHKRLDTNLRKYDGSILLITTPLEQNLIADLTVERRENYENIIIKICEIVSKMNRKLIIKLHPSQKEVGAAKFTKLYPKVMVVKGENILPLIESCEVLVSFDLSTTILMAQILKKPTISITTYSDLGKSEIFKSNSCVMINIDDFESTLNRVLKDDDYKQQLIENGTKFVNDYLTNQGTASQGLLSFLKEV